MNFGKIAYAIACSGSDDQLSAKAQIDGHSMQLCLTTHYMFLGRVSMHLGSYM